MSFPIMAAIAALGGVGRYFEGMLADGNYINSRIDPANASVGLDVFSDGTWQRSNSLGLVESGSWIVPNFTGVGADYEVRTVETSGTLNNGDPSNGAWISLGTSRGWGVVQSAPGIHSCDFTFEIRRASDSVVVVSRSYTFSANVEL